MGRGQVCFLIRRRGRGNLRVFLIGKRFACLDVDPGENQHPDADEHDQAEHAGTDQHAGDDEARDRGTRRRPSTTTASSAAASTTTRSRRKTISGMTPDHVIAISFRPVAPRRR